MKREIVIEATRQWIKAFVLQYNLCPFAHEPFNKNKIRYVVEPASTIDALIKTYLTELSFLVDVNAEEVETTLIVHPNVLQDFLPYNDFLYEAENLLEEAGLSGVIQVASFHPRYQFADLSYDDPANKTNRSPYPMLHLLREESVGKAVESYGDTDKIWQRNMKVMREKFG